jgi:hypothetical protein
MISKCIRAQRESGALEGMDDERRQLLEEAKELDHIWGIWKTDEKPTTVPSTWLKQPSGNRDDIRRWAEIFSWMKNSRGMHRAKDM